MRGLLLLAGLLAALLTVSARVVSGWAGRSAQLAVGIGGVRLLAVRSGKTAAQVAASLRAAGVGGLWLPEETPARLAAQGRLTLIAGGRWRDLRRAAGAPWPSGLAQDPAYLLIGAHHPRLAHFVLDGLRVALGARTSISERLVGGALAIGVGRSPAVLGALPLGFGPAGLAFARQTGLAPVPVVQPPAAGTGGAGVRGLFADLAASSAPVRTLALASTNPGGGAAGRRGLAVLLRVWRRSGWTLAVDAGPAGARAAAATTLRRGLGGSVAVYRVPAAELAGGGPSVARIVTAVQERGAGWVYLDPADVGAGAGAGGLQAAVSFCRSVAAALRAAGYRSLPPVLRPVDRPGVWMRLLGTLAVAALAWGVVGMLWPGRIAPWAWLAAGGVAAAAAAALPALAGGMAVLAAAGGAGMGTVCLAGHRGAAGSSYGRVVAVGARAAAWTGTGWLLVMALAPDGRGLWAAVPLAGLAALVAAGRPWPDAGPSGGGSVGAWAAAAGVPLAAAVAWALARGALAAVAGPWPPLVFLVVGWPVVLWPRAGAGGRRGTGAAWSVAAAAGLVLWMRGYAGLPPGLALRREGFALAVGVALGGLLWLVVPPRTGRGRALASAAGMPAADGRDRGGE